MELQKTVVIGAGPYGLSVAAHLRARGVPTQLFGKPMEFWENMPPGMHLKSVWSASSLSDPSGKYTLQHYVLDRKTTREEPVPLAFFTDYGQWFQQQTVPDTDPTYVQSVARDGKAFHLELADGRSLKAQRLIVAPGIASFTYIPEFARDLPVTLASHTQFHKDFTRFKGQKTAVIGGGQSGLQTAAFLHEVGADVELLVRGPVIWIDRRLYRLTGPAKHLFYPPSDVGPPGINWLTAMPQLYRRLSVETRDKLTKRATRPSGAEWLRHRVDNVVRTTANTHIVKALPHNGGLLLHLSDGTTREVDHLFMGTGYRASIHTLDFLDPALRQEVQEYNGHPLLNQWFESSVPRLHFVGALADYTFGPICRFVAGARASGRAIASHAASRRV
ncbi:MAG TPA: FAD-dependent oxidoreductase [Ktedonobacterales bacterium]|jgi:cation diffusion facilitator CzcD-associated flavoprotein CzcO